VAVYTSSSSTDSSRRKRGAEDEEEGEGRREGEVFGTGLRKRAMVEEEDPDAMET
jgi:hypothetical protein